MRSIRTLVFFTFFFVSKLCLAELCTFDLPSPPKRTDSTLRINFQPKTKSPPLGYLADLGEVYSTKSNGYTYGWDSDISEGFRDRNSFRSTDFRLNTMAHLKLDNQGFDATFNLNLKNGDYDVKVGLGDLRHVNQNIGVDLEGERIIFRNSGATPTQVFTRNVVIRDGNLTISSLADKPSFESKLLFLEVTPSEAAQLTPEPPKNLACEDYGEFFLLTWLHANAFTNKTLLLLSSPSSIEVSELGEIPKELILSDANRAQRILLKKTYLPSSVYLVHYDDSGKLSPEVEVFITPLETNNKLILKEQVIRLIEDLNWDDLPVTVNNVHTLFANTLYHSRERDLIDSKENISSMEVYASLNSVNVNITTRLALRARIQVSEDKAFNTIIDSQESPRLLHNHIFHLSKLQPYTPYFYRITYFENSKFHQLKDGRFVTKPTEDVLILSESVSTPIRLTRDNTTYVLEAKSQPYLFDNTAFIVSGDNVTLDLNGNTIEVITDSKQLDGAVTNGNKPLRKFSLINGIIEVEGKNCIVKFCNALVFNNIQRLAVNGLAVSYKAPNSRGVVVNAKATAFKSYFSSIRNNSFEDKFHVVPNRHGMGATSAILINSDTTKEQGYFEVANNLVLRSRQNGIQRAGPIFNNEIYIDSWATNSFAIQPRSERGYKGHKISKNKIFLTGYHAIGFGWSHEDLLFEDNFVEMQGINTGKKRWWEGFGDQNSLNGFRITNYGKGGQIRHNQKYHENTIIGVARNGSQMRGLQLWTDSSISGTEFKWGTVEIIAEDLNTLQAAPIVIHGTSNAASEHAISIYKQSTIRSNITFIRFGDYYGRGQNALFDQIQFEKIEGNPNFTPFIFDGGYTSRGHIVRNSQLPLSLNYNNVVWKKTSSKSDVKVELQLPHNLPKNAKVTFSNGKGCQTTIIVESNSQNLTISHVFRKNQKMTKSFETFVACNNFPLYITVDLEFKTLKKTFLDASQLEEGIFLTI